MTRSGWVAGEVIASRNDPRRGEWLTVRGSAYAQPTLHATRAAAVASAQGGPQVARVTEYPMGLGWRYRIVAGTLSAR